ncbi:hypothetical protein NMY22_g12812 [Coprinellus aureogranulatus]|nr:hypothetical protein NMY22_g12812 [Coprinellus aureogranulatus]
MYRPAAHRRPHAEPYQIGSLHAAAHGPTRGAQEERGGYAPVDPFKASLALGIKKVFGRTRDRTIDDVPVEDFSGGPPAHQPPGIPTHTYPDYYTPHAPPEPRYYGNQPIPQRRPYDPTPPSPYLNHAWYRAPPNPQPLYRESESEEFDKPPKRQHRQPRPQTTQILQPDGHSRRRVGRPSRSRTPPIRRYYEPTVIIQQPPQMPLQPQDEVYMPVSRRARSPTRSRSRSRSPRPPPPVLIQPMPTFHYPAPVIYSPEQEYSRRSHSEESRRSRPRSPSPPRPVVVPPTSMYHSHQPQVIVVPEDPAPYVNDIDRRSSWTSSEIRRGERRGSRPPSPPRPTYILPPQPSTLIQQPAVVPPCIIPQAPPTVPPPTVMQPPIVIHAEEIDDLSHRRRSRSRSRSSRSRRYRRSRSRSLSRHRYASRSRSRSPRRQPQVIVVQTPSRDSPPVIYVPRSPSSGRSRGRSRSRSSRGRSTRPVPSSSYTESHFGTYSSFCFSLDYRELRVCRGGGSPYGF